MTYDTIDNDVTMAGGAQGALLANRYRIVRQLGAGGMGSVWLAEDTQLDNKQFAIKMLPSILVSNKRAYRQLKDEALVAMQLVHPNIVQIRAFEENNGNPFLVMDYIDGETLDDHLAEKGKLSENEVVRILKPIAAALDYAHGEGVVHRDVKPANVMIRKDGTPYILDFGIAREMQETMTRVTGKLSSGTLLYMSPEQLRGQPPKAAQDVYSFAAMAYECLMGDPPFSRGQIEYQILNEQPKPLSDGIGLGTAIMRGLSKTPEGRPDSCVKVLLAASAIRQPPSARPKVAVTPRPASSMTDRIVVLQKHNIAGLVIPLSCLIVALLVFGGVLWYREVGRQESARKLAVKQHQEEARRRHTQEAERAWQKAEMEDVYAETKRCRGNIERVAKDNGFEKKISDFNELFDKADAFRVAGRYCEAAVLFTNVLSVANIIIALDEQRDTAVKAQFEAQKAKNEAEVADSLNLMTREYDRACLDFNDAEEFMRKMKFAEASVAYRKAKIALDGCSKAAMEKNAAMQKLMEQTRDATLERWNRAMSVSDEFGFKAKKQEVVLKLEKARRLESDSQWVAARQEYLSAGKDVDALLRLDEERIDALRSRKKAVDASKAADQAGAKKYATYDWNMVTNGDWARAEECLKNTAFKSAKESFEAAQEGYNACVRAARQGKSTAEALKQRQEAEQRRIQEECRKPIQTLPGRWVSKTKVWYENRADKTRHEKKYEIEFDNNGGYVERSIIGGTTQTLSGSWQLSGNTLTVQLSSSVQHYPTGGAKSCNLSGTEIYTVLWRGDGTFELRRNVDNWRQGLMKYHDSADCHYDANGTSWVRITNKGFLVPTTVSELCETAKVFRRVLN